MSAGWQSIGLIAAEVVMIVVGAALLERARRSPHWSRAVWQCALICIAALAVVEGCGLPGWWSGWVRPAPSAVIPQSPSAPPVPVVPAPLVEPARSTPVPASMFPVPVTAAGDEASSASSGPVQAALAVWVLGSALFLGYILLARVWLTCWLARLPAEPELAEQVRALLPLVRYKRRVRVVRSSRLSSPIAFGLFRPSIAVPSSFSSSYKEAERRTILLHELAHVSAHDPAWHLGADVLSALFWWHPAVWLARRRFLAACEMAADDAVRSLPDGARTLAETLVRLGTKLRGSWPHTIAQGAAFRSGLGRRVERLMISPGPARPRGLLVRLVVWIGPICLLCGAIFGSAWARPDSPQLQQKMKTTSLITSSLLATLAFAEAQPQPPPPVRPTAPTALTQPADPPPPPPAPARTRGPQSIQQKLESLTLEQVEFDSLPLGEVVRHLIQECARLDPDKHGINFVFQTPHPGPSAVDPATGLPFPTAVVEVPDLTGVIVRIVPPLKNVRLIDVLDAIKRVADRPIDYTVSEYAVVLRLASTPVESAALRVETFSIPAEEFFMGIEKTFGVEVRPGPPNQSQNDLKRFLSRLGVEIEVAGKTAFYSPETGVLMVRLTPDEVDIVGAAVRTLGGKVLTQKAAGTGGLGGASPPTGAGRPVGGFGAGGGFGGSN